ncbi:MULTISPECIES: hypothetical protein [Pseudoalteromonas]|uniref:Uncharacterized protein n=1 Tax=Pseudoalteromonas amylolytica TaxID=1859457 RepID=A0A1S1MYT8_9GAMM|nr:MULTISPECIES: hypothetical protein [Pseudoalteromonas]OHU90829.1 hypothetical protein BFC16_04320 [Pseudoalteromonas sp. JW3]OHU92551.1 hypothetical protein BET10_03570 [Pseudoalteromonas amylolytica]
MKNTDHFPPTHYDIYKFRQSFVDSYLRKDLENIKFKNLVPPFSSIDDFTVAFEEYWEEYKIDAFFQYGSQVVDSYDEFSLMLESSSEYPKMLYSATGEYLNAINFESFGKKTFYFSENLVERIAITELDAPAEFLKLPFKSCMFVFTGKTVLDAYYAITNNSVPTYSDSISVYISELPYKGYSKLFLWATHCGYEKNYCAIKRELLIHPDWKIDNAIRTDWDQIYDAYPDWADQDHLSLSQLLTPDDDDESRFFHQGRAFYRIVMNAVLYLASNDPDIQASFSPQKELMKQFKDVKSTAKQKKKLSAIKRISGLNGSLVGANMEPIRIIKGKNWTGSSSKDQMTLSLRFLVRGHWRNQRYGKNNKLRRLTFIEPYYKGPDVGEVINRPYIAK